MAVTKVSPLAVRFDLPGPYAPGERLFDSFWILPKHKLERPYAEGRLAQMWSLAATPDDLATPGPFRLKQYLPGQRIVLERNPYYWKRDEDGQQLPYLDRLDNPTEWTTRSVQHFRNTSRALCDVLFSSGSGSGRKRRGCVRTLRRHAPCTTSCALTMKRTPIRMWLGPGSMWAAIGW